MQVGLERLVPIPVDQELVQAMQQLLIMQRGLMVDTVRMVIMVVMADTVDMVGTAVMGGVMAAGVTEDGDMDGVGEDGAAGALVGA
jgi:hypothetical protein